jgi:hypothetical protein
MRNVSACLTTFYYQENEHSILLLWKEQCFPFRALHFAQGSDPHNDLRFPFTCMIGHSDKRQCWSVLQNECRAIKAFARLLPLLRAKETAIWNVLDDCEKPSMCY